MSAEDAPTVLDLMYRFVNDGDYERYDAAVGAYYASRVPDAREARWRADYSRAQLRWEKYEDRYGYPDAEPLLREMRVIEQRWITDPAVAPRWAELDGLRAHFDRSTAYPPPEEMSMPSEAPPGMDPVTWRSQLQARDMTGHGRWPDTTTTTSDREGAEPMNDTTRGNDQENPSRYPDLPGRYDDPRQEPMTPADAHWLLTGYGYTDAYADHLVTEMRGAGVELTSDNAREWMRRAGQQQGSADRDTVGEQPHGTGGSALADYRPGNAVADRLANTERDEVER
ncbi:hypothetical protein [Nocardia wallacei]|uniref:hypothetical protein n=1 Tax=Nocardia wallacei TaxID=480035 RepID=UPI0024558EB6|nr:hypothetical protein [Nocardia wallacei]